VAVEDRQLVRSLKKDLRLAPAVERKYKHLTRWYNEQLCIRYDLALDFVTEDLNRKLAHPELRDRDKRTGEYRSSIIMVAENGETQADSGFQAYKELVRSGQFYDHMSKLIQNECGTSFTDRKAAKTMLFQVLFTDNRFIGQAEAKPKRVFKSQFPGVYQLLNEIKKPGKSNLPILLQQIESHLVLKVITKRIARENPSLPLFTIHDSIITTTGNEEYVQRVVLEELGKVVGFAPQLRVERWTSENLEFGDGTSFAHNRKAVA
jgi:hypothetical protein